MAPDRISQSRPSPLMGEGGRRPDEGDATNTGSAKRARWLRQVGTVAEARLWELLRNRRLVGYKFRRQVPIGPFIADFACYDGKLVIELDGSQHYQNARDARRDEELAARGFEVVRVWNSELNQNPDGVLELILAKLTARAGTPSSALRAPSPTRGEGEGAEGKVERR